MANKPGEKFRYNDASPKMLAATVSITAQQDIAQMFYRTLMKPMKITSNMFVNMSMTSRDMLKFGLRYLNKGKWGEHQLISEDWVNESTKPTLMFNVKGVDVGYGYYWWQREFSVDNKVYKAHYAAGNGGQYIFIIPELNLVTVFTANNYGVMYLMENTYEIMEKYIIPSVVVSS